MNEINPIGGLATSATLREFANLSPKRSNGSHGAPAVSDRVEISELASFLSRLAELPEARARRIVEVRNAILEGSYETPEKLDTAVSRLLEEIGPQLNPGTDWLPSSSTAADPTAGP
jgi:negative regulator of flagellin synthesis FlgM